MRDLVQRLKKTDPKSVVIVGDIMLDEYVSGTVGRISPEAPVPVLREEKREWSFGGAANVAINCKHVGSQVNLIGLIGANDQAGEQLLSMLLKKGVLIEGVIKSPDRVTTKKKRIVSQNQQLLRIDTEDTRKLTPFEQEKIICSIHTIIKPGSVVLISDYAKGVIDRGIVKEIVMRAKSCDAIVVADPKGPDFGKYQGVTYLKPNLKEFYQIVDYFNLSRDNSVLENGRHICKKLNLQGLIVTMGEKGLEFIDQNQHVVYPVCKHEVYDITGAGDTILAFLSVGLASGFSIDQSLKLANKAASIAVSHHKTYAVGLDELLEKNGDSSEKIYWEWDKLKSELAWFRQSKKKIVFTNGCFDLLHSGHIFVLQEAKKRGDVLVVALNTDESVKRFKGLTRPIKTLEERAQIMAALGVVDYVVTFGEDTPTKLIEYLKPDVLVKGGDYKIENVAGYDVVTGYGGYVEVVDYKQGLSTSGLVKAAKLSEQLG